MPVIRFNKPNTTNQLNLSKPGKYRVELTQEGIEVNINGVFQAKNKDQLEVEIIIVHQAKRTTSHTNLRGIVDNQAFLSLLGTIVVESSAKLTNAFLTEKILLLSEKSKAVAVPNLEISTDEVKCSHAATISTLSEDQLFYIQSRGLNQKTAKKMLIDGFLSLPK